MVVEWARGACRRIIGWGAEVGQRGIIGAMNYELHIIQDCPNSELAAGLYRRVLEAAGGDGRDLKIRELASTEEAIALNFHGSPTFTVAGQDLYASDAEPALSCRIYPTSTGLAGLPAFEDLLRRVSEAISKS